MALINTRLAVEKKSAFQTEAKSLYEDLKVNLGCSAKSLRYINLYDIFDIEESVYEKAKYTVFMEPVTDNEVKDLNFENDTVIAIETLPGQYDQRADSAMQCVRLLAPSSQCIITCGRLIVLEGKISEEEKSRITKYVVNPIETRIKDMNKLALDNNVDVKPLEVFDHFIEMKDEEIASFVKNYGLAMSEADLKWVVDYFKNTEKRNPTETEIRVLDTYWSDHCRHTTFETSLKNVKITTDNFREDIQKAYEAYLIHRHENNRDEKPMTLMDLATINSRDIRRKGLGKDIEISDEINACSVFVNVDHDGKDEKWLLMFKNETHNHPTEIEPFGGASTCIGGAIRDPLSGRSYVYQAMRVSGVGNIFEKIENTIPGKLPQAVISKKATQGNSSYGNQIGLPTTHVREIVHDSYVAKHMEVGAVVGAALAENVKRIRPEAGDVIILLGGRTGRDGIGGATGSSKEHNVKSLEVCASEVQKGNAPEERKIQRLFRNPECTKLIKKCNDFGAGGVCVAIGELADGLKINLDAVRTKYAGLNATEIAISESQERMAVVVSAADEKKFIALARSENLEAYKVAEVCEEPRLIMTYHNEEVVNIARSFIDTSGVRQECEVEIATLSGKNPFLNETELTKENICAMLADPNVACQKGLVEMFDASIGSTTVLMPYGGKNQLTPAQASVQKLPVLDGKTTTCSILSYGFNPRIMEWSCFIGAQVSVIESMAKTIAVGGSIQNMYFSFQEYFERLGKDPKRWGKVMEALLGAMKVQDHFQKAAIGGKDSMSGTFNDLNVVPTLISFACSAASTKNIITPEFKKAGNVISIVRPDCKEIINLDQIEQVFAFMEENIANKNIVSAYALEEKGALAALFKMSFGNGLGFEIQGCKGLMGLKPGAFVIETEKPLNHPLVKVLGKVCEQDYKINDIVMTQSEALHAWMDSFASLYPVVSDVQKETIEIQDTQTDKKFKSSHCVDEVHVCIPVFPGTNCEYDTKRAFEEEGAVGEIVVFKNQSEELIAQSIEELVQVLNHSQILAIPGGFSSGDEPDGSAKFIVNVLQNEKVKNAVHALLDRDGLILGICNGFQALVKSGLVPYGRIQTLSEEAPTLFRNDISRHISRMVTTRVVSNHSPWLNGLEVGSTHTIAVSHGEGKFVCSEQMAKELFEKGCVAFQYADASGKPTYDPYYNVNGSAYAIEGITSFDGHVLGKMGHSERYFEDVFKNIPGEKKQNIFANGVNYFRKEN